MNNTAIIYARVSSSGSQEQRQNTERQVTALLGYANSEGLTVERMFEEHISGAKKNSERAGLQECLTYARDNQIGVILFSELSRAGRQIWEVLATVKFCVDNKIDMFFQKEGLRLFEGEKVNGVMAIYISCLSFCAEKEREAIAFRLNQGRELALSKGVRFGRKPGSCESLDRKAEKHADIIKYLRKGCSVRDTAHLCQAGVSTVQRVKKIFQL